MTSCPPTDSATQLVQGSGGLGARLLSIEVRRATNPAERWLLSEVSALSLQLALLWLLQAEALRQRNEPSAIAWTSALANATVRVIPLIDSLFALGVARLPAEVNCG